MYTDAYLAEEAAAHVQRERTAHAARSRMTRLALEVERCMAVSSSLVERVAAPLRPPPQPCAAHC